MTDASQCSHRVTGRGGSGLGEVTSPGGGVSEATLFFPVATVCLHYGDVVGGQLFRSDLHWEPF